MRIAVFQADVTPPVGSPVACSLARKIEDPLSARGIILFSSGKPLVLCAVDWLGIYGDAHEVWREELARAAGTTMDRVAVHTLHQHDTPRCSFTIEDLLAAHGLGGKFMDVSFERTAIQRTAQAVRAAVEQSQPVTHLGVGKAKVEKIASNRMILGPDGKVALIRFSKSQDPKAIAAPEGTIDPWVRLISFWNGRRPLAVLSYYATHPQSYYGKGDVTAEFVGMARAMREAELPGVPHIHFNGAGGNVAAGKYNDGSLGMRPVLAARLADGMKRAWQATVRHPLKESDLAWRTQRVRLPVAERLSKGQALDLLGDSQAKERGRLNAALDAEWLSRSTAGHRIELGCLRLGGVYVLHMPGELFVEYQLQAQKMKPAATVCMAAYGDYSPSYIGTEIAYAQGGYEVGVSRVAPGVEGVLVEAMRKLLRVEEDAKSRAGCER
ncbi:MAG: hypothetical protein PHV34_15830 [Verrucomicrobiae bacterium]|nr:hypothetical protein [Verrucomicrobiae bacterium]